LASRTSAYGYIHANREALHIPAKVDVFVEVYAAERRRNDRRLPRDIIVQYLWKETVSLDDPNLDFGPLKGEEVPLLCGGTLVFDENSNFLYWVTKPGPEFLKEQEAAGRKVNPEEWDKEKQKIKSREKEIQDYAPQLAAISQFGEVTTELKTGEAAIVEMLKKSFPILDTRLC